MNNESLVGTRFVVDLGDLILPSPLVKRVEAEIRAIVLRILAEMDAGGRSRLPDLLIKDLPGGTAGFVAIEVGSPATSMPDVLKPEDHTLIMKAIMERPFEIIQYMNKKDRTSNPSPIAILEATLQVSEISAYIKERIRMVLDILRRLEDGRRNAPSGLQRSVDDLQRRLAGRPIDEQIGMLRDLKSDYRSHEGLPESLEVAAQILEDGRSSIYSPEFPFYRMLNEGKRGRASRKPIDDIKDADVIGATAGGGVGVIVAGVGAAAGAAAGGAGASAGAAIAHVINWLFL